MRLVACRCMRVGVGVGVGMLVVLEIVSLLFGFTLGCVFVVTEQVLLNQWVIAPAHHT